MKHLAMTALLALLGLGSCQRPEPSSEPSALLSYVDPFVGTGAHGHTFPGATRPNAMVQFSPDTHLFGWEASSGYHDDDSLVYAFSLTHLSGTGIGDLGDVALLPYTGRPDSIPVGRLDKASEVASPGYYSVRLANYATQVELTSTERVGLMRLRYDEGTAARGLMLNLSHILQPNWGHRVVKNDLVILSDSLIQGTYYTQGWAEEHQMSYSIHLSEPARGLSLVRAGAAHKVEAPLRLEADSTALQLYIQWPEGREPLLVKVGLSHVSPEGAERNLQTELPRWDFDEVRRESRRIWADVLSRIEIESPDTTVLRNFYTALYHAHIAPYNYQDVDGSYRGIDKAVHRHSDPSRGHYTVFSLWDTYRTLHPLLTITDPERALRYGQSLVDYYREGGILPRWPLAESYTGCMIAYHAVSVLADLVAKGLAQGEDLQLWAEAAHRSAVYRDDLDKAFRGSREHDLITRHPHYKETLGFVPADSLSESVSWGVEMAYDDWCIARLAEAAGLDSLRARYDRYASYYQRYWDREYQLMRPVLADGSWRSPFRPRFSAHGKSDYTEGNAYQWSFYAPHDMEGFIRLMGGAEVLERQLDTLFTTSSVIEGSEASGDITGLIGQYAHGNEPSHHIAYLYNYTARPERGAELLDEIMRRFYQPTPEGIIGNEDCGQMSAWYVMSALGFYPVCPGSDVYHIGRPLVDEARIKVQGGICTIRVKNNAPAHKRVRSALLNGKPLERIPLIGQAGYGGWTLRHSDLKAGALLEIEMSR